MTRSGRSSAPQARIADALAVVVIAAVFRAGFGIALGGGHTAL